MAKFNDLREAVMAHDCARLRQLVRGGVDVDCRDSMKRTVLHYIALLPFTEKTKDVIQTLVNLGADINAADLIGITPLILSLSQPEDACLAKFVADNEMNNLTMKPLTRQQIRDITNTFCMSGADIFVSLGADINARFDHDVTSLHRAIQLNNIQGVETLLKLGVDVNALKKINCTALCWAILTSNTVIQKHLVELGADINSFFTEIPPLIQAVELGRMDIIKLLVKHGADVNTLKIDFTPVTFVIWNEWRLDVVKTLAQLGADLNAEMLSSFPLNEIVKVGRVDILEYLVRKGAQIIDTGFCRATALGLSVENYYHEAVDCLLKHGADVNVRYSNEQSTLMTAMRLRNIDMVKALVKLNPLILNKRIDENTTALKSATNRDLRTMKLLLEYGGDVNLKYSNMYPVHYAVAQGNGEMLRVLIELGANMNSWKVEGASLIHHMIKPMDLSGKQDDTAMIKLLVEAGLDLNQCYNVAVTPLHDAVRLGNLNMVQILAELKTNMNPMKFECTTPIFKAIGEGNTALIRYFVENGASINSRMATKVTPLNDAVRQGNIDMVRVLTNSVESHEFKKYIVTPLHYVTTMRNNEMLKFLLESGANVNAKVCAYISAMHEAVQNSDLAMIRALLDLGSPPSNTQTLTDQITPLAASIIEDHLDMTETLLKHGADINCLQAILRTPLDLALDQYKVECALLLLSQNIPAYRDTIGISPLHEACKCGYIDHARLLIIEGSDISKKDQFGKMPLEYLSLAETVDYHVLQEIGTAAKPTEEVSTSFVSTSGCQDMNTSLHTPGIGDVKYIHSPSATEVSQRANRLLALTIQQCKDYPGGKFNPVGSSAEGTRVGLPNEMDFLFQVQLAKDEERKIEDLGNGYVKYDYVTETMHSTGSACFHTDFIKKVMYGVFFNLQNIASDKKVSVRVSGHTHGAITDTDRKARSLVRLQWHDGDTLFIIPVDIVPSLHIDNWPEGATTMTWLMDEQELRSHGYVLVPKPPHVKSDLAKECTAEQLKTLWKISFPHLETEHMQRLEQRIKDVYITAKCLRNPDVCRIMITDEGSLPRTVSKYVTSYQLKMCFFKNVDYFRQHDLCLEEMVCKVYDDLVLGLSKNFIPLFFLPNVSALSGINLNIPKCLKVAKIMTRFVRALYLRDCLGDIRDGGDDLVMRVYQRKPSSVYRIYDITTGDV